MSYQLSVAELVNYDADQPGITVAVTLGLNQVRQRPAPDHWDSYR